MKKVMDPDYSYSTQHDSITLKIYICNIFDRNADFKNKAQASILEYLNFIEKFFNE